MRFRQLKEQEMLLIVTFSVVRAILLVKQISRTLRRKNPHESMLKTDDCGHLGVIKTYDCVLQYFFWPWLKRNALPCMPAHW